MSESEFLGILSYFFERFNECVDIPSSVKHLCLCISSQCLCTLLSLLKNEVEMKNVTTLFSESEMTLALVFELPRHGAVLEFYTCRYISTSCIMVIHVQMYVMCACVRVLCIHLCNHFACLCTCVSTG